MATPKSINLALQGGGAHGAFTWGVLEVILAEPGIEIAAMSGTSAGALNGAAVKSGLSQGSRALALETLESVWEKVGAITDPAFAPWLGLVSPQVLSAALETSLPFLAGDAYSRMVSPYASGPLYANPLEPIVSKFHYEDICGQTGPDFFICATNVRSGKIRVFSGEDISPKAIMASACLPTMFRAVEIDDPVTGKSEAYWDGGYTGNPALFPLFTPDLPRDIVIVNINPLTRDEVPTTARAIQNRINEISFNSSLFRELRAIAFVQRLLTTGALSGDAMKHVLIHMIADDDLMGQLSVATKTIATPQVMHLLRDAGKAAAEAFLRDGIDKIGEASTVDLRTMFE
ncbi:patatin-like phospholipase family protein [Rhodobacteraceae bacterium N5(2021)]|uniref:Patatin-like phospholipase family protein n=1 Tax=Gymnodinialimonas phycosphaerae TaxID=2841589 RepID=A0A975YGW7_9RHOB|nr:patatin-like phospholipase family protein [Gymnodinialimonas phycosphaerae]MBY4892127.1 patatin-like phospholipase family protein [Gymnodinialimonas phycosphaerae]